MAKYIFQDGGEDPTAGIYTQLINQLYYNTAQQDIADNEQQEGTQPATEEESEFIKGLRSADEEQPDNTDHIEQRFKDIEDKLNQKLDNLFVSQQNIDFFNEPEGQDYLLESYDTQTGEKPFSMNSNMVINTGSSRNNYGNIRGTNGQFKNYSTPEEGKAALVNQLNLYKTGKTRNPVKPTSTLYQAMAVYAPAADKNNPKAYAEFIAKKLGISPATQLKDVDVNQWADAIAEMEGNKNIGQ